MDLFILSKRVVISFIKLMDMYTCMTLPYWADNATEIIMIYIYTCMHIHSMLCTMESNYKQNIRNQLTDLTSTLYDTCSLFLSFIPINSPLKVITHLTIVNNSDKLILNILYNGTVNSQSKS